MSLRLPRAARAPFAALALLLAVAPARAEITPEARPVVDRLVQTLGGRAAIDSIRGIYFRASATAFGLTGTTEVWTQAPDRRATRTVLGPFTILEGFDGVQAWRTDPGSGEPVVIDGKDLEDAKGSAYFESERWLAPDQGGGKVALGPAEKDSAGAYSVIEVTPPVGRPRKFYIDRKTGLVSRATTKRDHVMLITSYSDYRKVSGRQFAFRQLTQIVDMPANDLSVVVDSLVVNPVTPAEQFRVPGSESQAARWLKTPGIAKLPIEYSAHHVWVKASVNGLPAADFLYDTGASITVIDSAYAVKIGLETQGRLQGQGAGAAGSAAFAEIQSLELRGPDGDGVEVKDARVAVLSVNTFLAPFFWRDCAGVVGYDFIQRFVNEIHYDDERLVLHDPAAFQYSGKGTAIPFTLAGTVPAVRMKLDDTYEGEFRVDVGSGSTVDLHGPFAAHHGIAKRLSPSLEVVGGGFGGTFKNVLGRMKKIEIGPYSWEKPLVSFSLASSGAFASTDYAGNIGNQILSRFVCTLDYERRTLYLEPGARYPRPDGFSRAGCQLARFGDTVKAMQVLQGSPAAKAGLREGDEVTTMDGKPIVSYTAEDLAQLFDEGEIGREVVLGVKRDGKSQKIRMKLAVIL